MGNSEERQQSEALNVTDRQPRISMGLHEEILEKNATSRIPAKMSLELKKKKKNAYKQPTSLWWALPEHAVLRPECQVSQPRLFWHVLVGQCGKQGGGIYPGTVCLGYSMLLGRRMEWGAGREGRNLIGYLHRGTTWVL